MLTFNANLPVPVAARRQAEPQGGGLFGPSVAQGPAPVYAESAPVEAVSVQVIVDWARSAWAWLRGKIEKVMPAPAPGPTPTPTPTPAPAPAPAPSVGSVTVQRGDSLSLIAQRHLGDANRWREIFDLNRDQVSNPNLIYAGQVLRLPGGSHAHAPAAPAPSAPSGKWAWPVQGRISSPYGMRTHPINGSHSMHTGTDIAAASGTPVTLPLPGSVVSAGWNGGYGNYVVVQHANGLQTCYAHLSAINVSKGQQLGTGAVIGKVGSTGNSTGPHLHFEVKRNGQFVNSRDFLS